MPRRYPVEFRRKVLDLIEAGRPVVEIAAELGVSDQTIYNWRNQDRIDRGLRSGVTTAESVQYAAPSPAPAFASRRRDDRSPAGCAGHRSSGCRRCGVGTLRSAGHR